MTWDGLPKFIWKTSLIGLVDRRVFRREDGATRLYPPFACKSDVEQHAAFAWMDGHGTEPYEQNMQQSPERGLSRFPQPLQS